MNKSGNRWQIIIERNGSKYVRKCSDWKGDVTEHGYTNKIGEQDTMRPRKSLNVADDIFKCNYFHGND